ncbi:uncharacterized protein LOC9638847 [Selaginella moellendorffii]|uniref:uncharacterized protein LOC9638847 n=1 Tax=Selaginella moellendorffii TaxID=88036 RepID=UPI000D1CD476|nr:uncharacterized protein LOC9638847 [Selaginella moellendorffii]|eukprot:XP_024523213.1 uncharacterized protein LOC9638847 [Selaginella moellendorffii]
MGSVRVALLDIDEIVKRRRCGVEKEKWSIKGMGLEDVYLNSQKEPRTFLERYLSKVREYSGVEQQGKGVSKRGEIIAVISSVSLYSHVDPLDEALGATDWPYVCYGLLFRCGYYMHFYRWERFADGSVEKLGCDSMYNCNNQYLCSTIGPAICGMFKQTGNSAVKIIDVGTAAEPVERDWSLYPGLVPGVKALGSRQPKVANALEEKERDEPATRRVVEEVVKGYFEKLQQDLTEIKMLLSSVSSKV